MSFIETPIFTKLVVELLSDESYAELQQMLIFRPEAGDVIPRSGGLRKLRWRTAGHGKRGGLRVIYYWDKPNDRFYMVFLYKKNQQADLTPTQIRILKGLVEEYLA
jgi:mRNA-degrading endonuclease RelE of RelBE toxin-antitoxin system